MSERIEPVDFDRDTSGFFKAAREGRLVYRACTACGKGVHPPAPYCPACGSATDWRDSRGRGRLYSWTTVPNTVHPAYPAPYTVVVVALDEAPNVRLIGTLPGAPELRADQPMQVYFDDEARSRGLPQFRCVDDAAR
jgi:uncharacterized protein